MTEFDTGSNESSTATGGALETAVSLSAIVPVAKPPVDEMLAPTALVIVNVKVSSPSTRVSSKSGMYNSGKVVSVKVNEPLVAELKSASEAVSPDSIVTA